MQHNNTALKLFTTIAAIGMVIWFGGSIMRGVVAYDLFIPTPDNMQADIENPVRAMSGIFYFSSMALYTAFGYIAAFISIIILNILSKGILKQNGWLFMVFVLFYLTVPVESVRLWYDYNLSVAIFEHGVNDIADQTIQNYFFDRYESNLLTTLFTLSMMANLTALIYLIWRPLDKREKMEETSES